jgi:hypothetical protein
VDDFNSAFAVGCVSGERAKAGEGEGNGKAMGDFHVG